MKKNLKKYLPEILTFIVPILIMLISCIVNKTYPFGKEILPKYDGYYQYSGFTSYYKNVLIMNVVFNVYDGLKPCTFFANGGFRLISGQTSSWYKSKNEEDKNLFYSAKEYEWVDSFDGSITSFRPFYGKVNTETRKRKIA